MHDRSPDGPHSPPPPPRGHRLFWIAHGGFWGAALAVNLLLAAAFAAADPPGFIALEIAGCFLATGAIHGLSLQRGGLVPTSVAAAVRFAALLLLAAALIGLVLLTTRSAFGLPAASWPEIAGRTALTFGMLVTWGGIWSSAALVRGRHAAEIRALEAESLALRHELEHIRARTSPHFLLNALNTVLAHRDDPRAIETVTESLAKCLQHVLRPAAPLEPLAREIDALEDYLTVQGMRFGAALESRIDCDYDARRVAVVPVMVQPLVENAIKHGLSSSPVPLRVHVAARLEDDRLTVEVANTGRWVPPRTSRPSGAGLESLARRLRIVVGPEATLTHREEAGWVRVVVRIPAASAADPQVVRRADA